jgi:arylformamidase
MRKKKYIFIGLGLVVVVLISSSFLRPNHNKNTQTGDADDSELISDIEAVRTPVSTDEYTVTEYSYGPAEREKLDVYSGDTTTPAPIIVMVHGGGWQIGDKASAKVVKNKVAHYIPQGYMFISVNYPMIPDGVAVDGQADALADALIYIQKNAAAWGGDADRMVVMGHSAGAHLVSLVSATRTFYPKLAPWSGTILLDSAAYDVTATMETRPTDVFTEAFGEDQAYWVDMSPLVQLSRKVEPHFVVCSSKRSARVCDGAGTYVNKLRGFGTPATLYPVALSHEDINESLGQASDYTDAVDEFLRSL